MPWYSAPPYGTATPGGTAAPVASLLSSRTAGGTISGHRALMFSGAVVVHADPTSAGYAFAGISTGAAISGAAVQVCEAGDVTEPTWAWTPGAPLYVGPLGALTQTPPTTGVLHQIAVATSPTTVCVTALPPITRM